MQCGLALYGVVDCSGPEVLLSGGDDADRAGALRLVEQLLNLAGADQLVRGPPKMVLVDPSERSGEREPRVVPELGHDLGRRDEGEFVVEEAQDELLREPAVVVDVSQGRAILRFRVRELP